MAEKNPSPRDATIEPAPIEAGLDLGDYEQDQQAPKDDPKQYLFEIRNAGKKGLGLFATQAIKRGTRIFAECPLIMEPQAKDHTSLWEQFDELPTHQRAQLLQLSPDSRPIDAEDTKDVRAIMEAAGSYRGAALDAAVQMYLQVLAITQTNAVDMGPAGEHGAGVFPLYSRANHCCTPNMQNSYNSKTGKQVVHAVRDIVAGEELTTTYVCPIYTREERLLRLREAWGFACDCAACEGDAMMEHEVRRRFLSHAWYAFERSDYPLAGHGDEQGTNEENPTTASSDTDLPVEFEEILNLTESEQSNNPALGNENGTKNNNATPAVSPASRAAKHAELLAFSEMAVMMLKEEGLVGLNLAEAYRRCSEYSLAANKLQKALEFANQEVEVERYCMGSDSVHSGEDMSGAEDWLKYLEAVNLDAKKTGLQ